MPYNNYSDSSDSTKLSPTFTASSNSGSNENVSLQPTVDSSGKPIFNPTINSAGHITGSSPIPSGTSSTSPSTGVGGSAASAIPSTPLNPAQLGTSQPNTYQASGLTGGVNPTNVTQSNQSFGTGADQFMIDPFMQGFNFDQQKTENSDYLNRFSNFLANQQTPEAIRQQYENRYGYQNLREDYLRTGEAASSVMDAIRATPDNVKSRGGQTIMTQAQLGNIVNKEVKGLMETYTSLGQLNEQQGRRLAMVEQNMNEAAKLEMAQQQKMMTPWMQEYQDKNIMQAREYSGWTFANQLELNRLISNQQAGFNWTNAEATRANQLAMQEKQFAFQLDYLEKQNDMALELWN